MTKDAEKLLKYIVDVSKHQNNVEVEVNVNAIKNIPNIQYSKNKLLNELEAAGVICGYNENILGEVFVYLTTDGLEYFDNLNRDVNSSSIVFNVSGGQVNIANDNGKIESNVDTHLPNNEKLVTADHKLNKETSSSLDTHNGKVFISYSWTPESNKKWVEQLVHKLEKDGVQVIIDFKDLKLGHDKYAFMERMVNDVTIEKVLIICNKEYKEKADSRMGGVGDESIIITPQIYESTIQEKFIPVVNEYDENGKPYLPNYLASRMYADLTDFEKGYKELFYNIVEADSPMNNDKVEDNQNKEVEKTVSQSNILTYGQDITVSQRNQNTTIKIKIIAGICAFVCCFVVINYINIPYLNHLFFFIKDEPNSGNGKNLTSKLEIYIDNWEFFDDGFYYENPDPDDPWFISYTKGISGNFHYSRDLTEEEKNSWSHGGNLYDENGNEVGSEGNYPSFWSSPNGQFAIEFPKELPQGNYVFNLYQDIDNKNVSASIQFSVF